MNATPFRAISTSPWLVLFAGLIVRIAIAPLGAHPGDFATLTGWARASQAHGMVSVYQASDANYPPLALALLGLSRWVYGLLLPGDPAGPLWMILLKLPAILADCGIGWLIGRLARWRGNPLWPVAGIAFNPALIYLSAWWGQFESVYMLAVLAALTNALDGHNWRAGLWLGAGLMIKLQAAVVVPAILLALFAKRESLARLPLSAARFVAGVALPSIAGLAPYALTGQIELVLLRLIALVSGPGWLTVNALNFWYLVTLGAGNWGFNQPLTWPDTAPIFLHVSAHSVGWILLAVWSVAVIIPATLHRRENGAGCGIILHTVALLYLGIFLWPTQAHERYAFGAVVMLAASAAAVPSCWRSIVLYLLATLAHGYNLVWSAPFSAVIQDGFAYRRGTGVVGAVAILGIAVWGFWLLVKAGREPPPSRAAA